MSEESGVRQPRWLAVLDAAQVPDGEAVAVRVSGQSVVIVRGDAGLRALSGICPHDLASLAGGEVRGGTLVCPRHRACFDVDSGACVEGFDLPPLTRYPVRLRDGKVEVDAHAVSRAPPLAGPRERWDLTGR